MKIQPIGYSNYNQNFGAKLAPATLKSLSKEFSNSPEGNKALDSLLGKVSKMGLRDTRITIGALEKGSEYVTISQEYPDELISYDYRAIMIENPHFAGVKHWIEEKFYSSASTMKDVIERLCNYKTVETQEAFLFRKHLDENPDKQPMKVFSEFIPVLGSNKDSFRAIFSMTKLSEAKFLTRKEGSIKNKQLELDAMKKDFDESKAFSQKYIEDIDNIIKSDQLTERDAILSKYI